MATTRRIAEWTGALFMAAVFILVGLSKLEGGSAIRWRERFEHWGYPANIQYVVGAVEILGGLGVLIPRWRRAGALTLGVLMMGAMGTHIIHGEFPRVLPPLVLGGLAFLVYWSPGRSKQAMGKNLAD